MCTHAHRSCATRVRTRSPPWLGRQELEAAQRAAEIAAAEAAEAERERLAAELEAAKEAARIAAEQEAARVAAEAAAAEAARVAEEERRRKAEEERRAAEEAERAHQAAEAEAAAAAAAAHAAEMERMQAELERARAQAAEAEAAAAAAEARRVREAEEARSKSYLPSLNGHTGYVATPALTSRALPKRSPCLVLGRMVGLWWFLVQVLAHRQRWRRGQGHGPRPMAAHRCVEEPARLGETCVSPCPRGGLAGCRIHVLPVGPPPRR